MPKFIEVNEKIINIKNIKEVEFISDDIYIGLFPEDIKVEKIPFTYAKIKLFSGEDVDLSIDLYYPEDNRTEDSWIKENRSYINISMRRIRNALKDIAVVSNLEYESL